MQEEFEPEDAAFPALRQIGEVFAGEYVSDGNTTWLQGNLSDEHELEKQLDKIDKMDLRSFILPPNWESEKKRIYETYGKRPEVFNWVRGR